MTGSVDDLRDEARSWLAEHRHLAPPLDCAHEPMSYEADSRWASWTRAARAGRWLCLSWPESLGGRGLDATHSAAVDDEFARAGVARPRLGMGEQLVAPAVLAHGTPAQQREFLPRILDGTDVYCQGFSEPDAGSDLARLRTRGVVDGDEIVIDGRKMWQSGAHRATMIFVLCRTDDDASRHDGLSYVLLPIDGERVVVEPIRMMTGDHGFASVRLDGARAPLSNVIGGLGSGWRAAMTTLGQERAGEAITQFHGYRSELLDLVRTLGFGTPDDTPPPDLVSAYLQVELMRSTGRRIADALASGDDCSAALAVDKVNWSEFHAWFGEMAVEQLGLDGLMLADDDGYRLTKFQRILLESRGRRIARGTNQVQRNIIAERVLGLPR